MNDFFQRVISVCFKKEPPLKSIRSVAGGCINNTYRLETSDDIFFLKFNSKENAHMFECEAMGLALLESHSKLKVPKVLHSGTLDGKAFLLLEWIDKGYQHTDFWRAFATDLAGMHRVSTDTFGLDHDNYIGRLPQSNRQHSLWHDFFREERMMPQIKLARSRNLIDYDLENRFEKFFKRLEVIVPKETPSFLHGDLWNGNFMTDSLGNAAFFDPAVHYGHRETEIAFTKLFGGFSDDFYHVYNEVFPIENGFEDRIDIHNLYPLLVHLNLFGTSYLSGIIQTLNRFA